MAVNPSKIWLYLSSPMDPLHYGYLYFQKKKKGKERKEGRKEGKKKGKKKKKGRKERNKSPFSYTLHLGAKSVELYYGRSDLHSHTLPPAEFTLSLCQQDRPQL